MKEKLTHASIFVSIFVASLISHVNDQLLRVNGGFAGTKVEDIDKIDKINFKFYATFQEMT